MQTEDRKVDWERIKRCLSLIDKESKDFLRQALLIGGAATWFYRNRLVKANDPDFRVKSNAQDEERWLSRDIDFTGVFQQDAILILPHFVKEHKGRQHIEVDGIRFGFAQVGVALDPEEAIKSARVVDFMMDGRKVEFMVADPLTLYYEKCKLAEKRGNPNDHLHKELLFDYTAYELVHGAEQLLKDDTLPITTSKVIIQRWLAVAGKTPEIIADSRLRQRLDSLSEKKPNNPIARFLQPS